jgi:hypothetical protein
MSSDNQFTALGPAIVGFQTDAANIDRGAEIHGNSVGIKGFCDGPVGDGVQGFGSGAFSGVAGFGADVASEINGKHDFRVDVGRTARSSAVGITSDSYGCGPDTRCDRLL